ncbi:hypothetical protein DXG01_001727 [Tephrocybe rancida]|nr:hypothetical protein DXG01_001727 [Tephrocybe rancida]
MIAPTPELTHLLRQLKSNIDFLVEQGHVSRGDAQSFVSKLPSTSASPAPVPYTPYTPPNNNTRAVPLAPRQQQQQAKAIWGYNENGEEEDLSFHAGDTITIIEETNADWWTGSVHGKQALFPSAYVEKIVPTTPSAPPPSTSISQAPFASNSNATGKPYRPFGAALHGRDIPPPAGAGTNSVGLQEKPGTEEKKGKFGKYKETVSFIFICFVCGVVAWRVSLFVGWDSFAPSMTVSISNAVELSARHAVG